MDKDSGAAAVFDKIRGQLFSGFTDAERNKVKESVLRWLEAYVASYEGRSVEEKQVLVESTIPNYILEQIRGLSKKQRYEFATTAFERWRLDRLSMQTLARAETFRDKKGNPQQLKEEAERDLKELHEIEEHLMKEFPDVHRQYFSKLSESKLDCLYIIRDGKIASRRLAL